MTALRTDPSRPLRRGALSAAPALVLAFGCVCDPPPPPVPDAGPGEQCAVDGLYNADTAATLELGEEQQGHLCPALDADFYRFTVAEAGSVVRVHVWMDTHFIFVELGVFFDARIR